jgi:hypothetical protein
LASRQTAQLLWHTRLITISVTHSRIYASVTQKNSMTAIAEALIFVIPVLIIIIKKELNSQPRLPSRVLI